jgi:hypothetical protein
VERSKEDEADEKQRRLNVRIVMTTGIWRRKRSGRRMRMIKSQICGEEAEVGEDVR